MYLLNGLNMHISTNSKGREKCTMKIIFSLSWSVVRLARELSVICFSAHCSGNISYLDIHISAILKQRLSLKYPNMYCGQYLGLSFKASSRC